MNSFARPLVSTLLACALAAPVARASDSKPVPKDQAAAAVPEAAPAADASASSESGRAYSINYDASFCSKYLFQGLDYSDGKTVTQPELVLGWKNLTATGWFNFQPDLSEWNEVDLTVKASHAAGKLTMAGGYNYLTYPNRDGWDPSQEVLFELGADLPLHPAFNVHYDFDAGDGAYAQLGVSQAVHPKLTLATNLYYQSHYYEMTGVPSVEMKASTQFAVGTLTLTPALSYFGTRDNGDFRDDLRPRSTWLVAVNVAQQVR